jgi:hypothetical protein
VKSIPKQPKKAKMVGWYDPSVFLLTGIDTLISTIFGQRSDFRQIEALTTPADESDQAYINGQGQPETLTEQIYYDFRYHYKLKEDYARDEGGHCNGYEQDTHGRYLLDLGRSRDEIWIDYVADTGDGWDSTYTVAYYLTQPSLKVMVPEDKRKKRRKAAERDEDSEAKKTADNEVTQRGEILIFGGDQVYPSADHKSYQCRLVAPYENALAETKPPQPFLFATPGNHDWYDSLVSFTRLFCSQEPFPASSASLVVRRS